MNTIKTSEELKMNAKGLLLGNYGKMISALLCVGLPGASILFFADRLLPASEPVSGIIYAVIEFLVSLLFSVFMLGQAKLYMNFATGRPYRLGDLLYGFQSRSDIGIKLMLVRIGITLVCLIPFFALLAVYTLVPSSYLVPFLSLALAAGMILACMQQLSLSQCFYIAVDFPDYRLQQILAMSRRVMKGQRARLFYLYVSFLPLILLSLLSFGAGYLWVFPYMQGTLVHFYLDLMDYHTKQYA